MNSKLKKDSSAIKVAVEKMSKSKFNGVDPDDMVSVYGADAVRIFTLFAAPVENELVWQETGIDGAVRFLQRLWRFVFKWKDALNGASLDGEIAAEAVTLNAKKLRQKTHQTIKRITENFETGQYNTPVAGLMELSNAIHDLRVEPDDANSDELFAVNEAVKSLILMLTPFAPHVCEELWETLTGSDVGILASGARFPIADDEIARSGRTGDSYSSERETPFTGFRFDRCDERRIRRTRFCGRKGS